MERQNDRLQQSERELRELIETIPEMAWTAAPDGLATFVNGRWSDYTRLSLEATLGFGWKFAVHSDDLERHVERIEDALKILEGWWKLINRVSPVRRKRALRREW